MRQPKHQSGNALFLILIAVILFAALAYAITKSQGGNAEQASKDKLSVEASKVSNILSAAATEFMRLRLKGCSIEEIDQASSNTPASANCAFYSKNGGAFAYPNSFPVYDTTLLILNMPGIGSDKKDVVFVYFGLKDTDKAVCDHFNEKQLITHTIDTNTSPMDSSMAAWQEASLDDNAASTIPADFTGKSQGCMWDGGWAGYGFYNVIEER